MTKKYFCAIFCLTIAPVICAMQIDESVQVRPSLLATAKCAFTKVLAKTKCCFTKFFTLPTPPAVAGKTLNQALREYRYLWWREMLTTACWTGIMGCVGYKLSSLFKYIPKYNPIPLQARNDRIMTVLLAGGLGLGARTLCIAAQERKWRNTQKSLQILTEASKYLRKYLPQNSNPLLTHDALEQLKGPLESRATANLTGQEREMYNLWRNDEMGSQLRALHVDLNTDGRIRMIIAQLQYAKYYDPNRHCIFKDLTRLIGANQ